MVKSVTPSSFTDRIAGTADPMEKPPTDRISELPSDTTMALLVRDDTEVADFLMVWSCCGGGIAPAAVHVSVGVRLTPVALSAGAGAPAHPEGP